MKTRLILLLALVGTAFAITQSISAEDKKDEGKKKFACKCPVSGQAAKEDSFVEYKGKKVYFCCEGCPEKFKADAKPFEAKANHQLAVTGQILQVACPFSGEACDDSTAVDVDGVKVSFCCNKCKGKVESAKDAVSTVFASIDKGFTLQTECPISGKTVDVKNVVEYKGKNVYFCCDKCPAAFEKEPEKYLEKLPQFADDKKKE